MHKPDKPLDRIEEVENILSRLVPSAMSERASRASEAMIDGLSASYSTPENVRSQRRYGWAIGIAASFVAGVGFVFLDPPSQYEFVKAINSTTRTSDEIWIEQADEIPQSAATYKQENISVIFDKKNEFTIHIGRRDVGELMANISEF